MPRTIGLFRIPKAKLEKLGPEGIASELKEASLIELLRYFEEINDKASLRRIEALRKIIRDLDARLILERTTSRDARFMFSYTYLAKVRYVVKGERRMEDYPVTVEHPVWIRVHSGLLLVFDSPSRRISRAIGELVSLRLFNDVSSVTPLHLERDYVLAIEKWVTSKEYEVSGNIIRATFKRASLEGSVLEEISIKKEGLDTLRIYDLIKSSAHEIKSLTFVTPLLPQFGKRVTCKIDNRGGLVIYTPGLRVVDIEVIINELERVLGLTEG
ncbi:MAG: hypothetical protein DRJ66_05840 [Thermoprotei archaeon]|nr:MAG: hypothetical protein DRJ66_05840 [Thermoprotei archaeon]RLF20149.1 MAG: hypothetical protein DRZ82_03415 [Thermoprotei archaeon]